MNAELRSAQQAMLDAVDYRSWRDAAAELDRIGGLDEWKLEEASEEYDWRLIRSRLRQIRQLRNEHNPIRLAHHLRQGLHWNLGNIGNPELYRVARIGTKKLIHDYVHEVCDALEWLVEAEGEGWALSDKLKFFHDVALSYGRSALMLSGGATLGKRAIGMARSASSPSSTRMIDTTIAVTALPVKLAFMAGPGPSARARGAPRCGRPP